MCWQSAENARKEKKTDKEKFPMVENAGKENDQQKMHRWTMQNMTVKDKAVFLM